MLGYGEDGAGLGRPRVMDFGLGRRPAAEGQKDFLYFLSIDRAHSARRENDVSHMLEILPRCDPGRRWWEWHYLWHLCHSDLHTLKGHTGPVNSACFSPDASRLASASDDRTVKIWDAGPGARQAK
jgi:hypothetical protein